MANRFTKGRPKIRWFEAGMLVLGLVLALRTINVGLGLGTQGLGLGTQGLGLNFKAKSRPNPTLLVYHQR